MLRITLVFIWGLRAWIHTCTGGGEYTKNSWRNTIIKKANTYLIRTMELAKEKPVSAQWFLI
jgi:hypothetical protein